MFNFLMNLPGGFFFSWLQQLPFPLIMYKDSLISTFSLTLIFCHLIIAILTGMKQSLLIVVFFKYFIYLFLERGEGKKKERERNISVVAPHTPLLGTCPQPGMCCDWEWN